MVLAGNLVLCAHWYPNVLFRLGSDGNGAW
jgi:hypothetical protein